MYDVSINVPQVQNISVIHAIVIMEQDKISMRVAANIKGRQRKTEVEERVISYLEIFNDFYIHARIVMWQDVDYSKKI